MIKKKEIFITQKRENDKYSQENKRDNNKNKKGYSTGRIKKSENKKGKHNNLSIDNIIKKIKGKGFNCMHLTLNNIIKRIYKDNKKKFKCKNKKKFLNKICYSYIRNGKKDFNEEFLRKIIKDIYLLNISSKYKTFNNNNELIEECCSNNLFKEIVNMTFNEFIYNIFIMKSNEFKEKYSFYNKYLLDNLNIKDEEEKSSIDNLIKDGLLNYFNKIKGRNKKILNNNTTKMSTKCVINDMEEFDEIYMKPNIDSFESENEDFFLFNSSPKSYDKII